MEINFSLADDLLEFPFFGSGDFRCTALRLRGASGDSCTSFDYKSYEEDEKVINMLKKLDSNKREALLRLLS